MRKLMTAAGVAALSGLGLFAGHLAKAEAQPAAAESAVDGAADNSALTALGEQLWGERCASCHEQEDIRAPQLADMRVMSPAHLRFTMTDGKMQPQAQGLTGDELSALIRFIAPDKEEGYVLDAALRCEDPAIRPDEFDEAPVTRWGVDAGNSHYYPGSRIDPANVGGLEVAWTFGMPDTTEMRSQPVVTERTVFAAVPAGHVFALDRETGCVKWHRNTETLIRAPLTLGNYLGEPALIYQDGAVKVHVLSVYNGDTIWSADASPMPGTMGTAGVVQSGETLFVPVSATGVAAAMNPEFECCKSHGAVVALDLGTGERKWVTHMTEDATPREKNRVGTQLWGPSGVPVWATPAVDEANGRIYIGTGENTSLPATDTSDSLMALDMETGEVLWHYQATRDDTFNMACSLFGEDGPNCPSDPAGPDYDFGGGVTFAALSNGREVVVGGQKSGDVHVVDAATGELIWKRRVGAGSALGGVHWGLAVADGTVIVPIADPNFPMPGYEPVPGVYALDLDTGEPLWSYRVESDCEGMDCPRDTFSAAPAVANGLVFVGALDGKARALDLRTGEELWTFETAREFESVSDVAAKGGAIDNPGIQVAGDMLFIPSGYSLFRQLPGNALIALKAKGE